MDAQHVDDVEEGVKHEFLRDYTQQAPRLAEVTDGVVAEHGDVARAGSGEARNNVDEGGFARAIGPEQAEEFALMDVEPHAFERLQRTEGLLHTVDAERGGCAGGRHGARVVMGRDYRGAADALWLECATQKISND